MQFEYVTFVYAHLGVERYVIMQSIKYCSCTMAGIKADLAINGNFELENYSLLSSLQALEFISLSSGVK